MRDGYVKKFVITDEERRQRTINYLYELPLDTVKLGWKILICEELPEKTNEQQKKYHAMLRDIAKSGKFNLFGRTKWTLLPVKRLMIDAFAKAMREAGTPLKSKQGEVLPSIDGQGFVYVENSSSDFDRYEASDFIEYLYAYGSEIGVRWGGESLDALAWAKDNKRPTE